MTSRRVCAIGLDSADWPLVESMLVSGDLPHLARLRARSAFARLEYPDYRTGLAWEHFLTGRGTASSRRWSAVAFDPTTYETWKEGAMLQPPFFALEPVETVAFDIPYLSRSFPVPGAQVTGWGGHDPGYPPGSNPRPLYAEIESRFGVHPASANDYETTWHRPPSMERLADALVVGARRRADILLWLARQHPDWRLLLTVQSEPHSANEQYWHGIDETHPVASVSGSLARRRLLEVYRAVDDAVGRIVNGLDDDVTIVVFSMHGAYVNEGDIPAMVLLPELIHRLHGGTPRLTPNGAEKWRSSGCPPVVPGPEQQWGRYVRALYAEGAHAPDPMRAVLRSLARSAYRRLRGGSRQTADAAFVPPRVGAQDLPIPSEERSSPDEIGVPRSSITWQQPCWYQDQWPEMRFFALPTFYDGRVRLNVAGRESRGRVSVDSYVAVCEEVERHLRACRDARTGREVVADVRRLRCDDPMAEDGPDADLEIIFSGATDAWVHPDLGMLGPVPFRRTGSHSSRGFAMIAGPGVNASDLGTHSAFDVTPTVLSLLHGKVPPGAAFDGTALIDAP